MLTLLLLSLLPHALSLALHPANDTQWCIHASPPAAGTQLLVEECTGAPAQAWNFWGSSSVLQLNGTALCAAPEAEEDGARVYLAECGDQRAWGAVMWHPAGRGMSWANSVFCLDNEDGRLAAGNAVQIWWCYDGAPQTWGMSGTNGPRPPYVPHSSSAPEPSGTVEPDPLTSSSAEPSGTIEPDPPTSSVEPSGTVEPGPPSSSAPEPSGTLEPAPPVSSAASEPEAV